MFALLVAAQFALVIAIIFNSLSASPSWSRGLAQTLVGLTGVAIGVWAIVAMGRRNLNVSPSVRDGAELVERGPYRLVRHPMYSGLLLFSGALVMTNASAFSFQLWFSLVVVLAIKSLYEESLLKQTFSSYADYMKRTWRFVPYVI